MPLFGPPNVKKLKAKGNVKGLVKALRHRKDVGMREAAAEALSTLDWRPDRDADGARYWIERGRWDECVEIGEPALGPLVSALASLSKGEGAAQALGRIGDPRAVAPLIAVLESETTAWRDVRAEAARALGQIGDVRAVMPLIVPLRDGYSTIVPKAALEALVMIGPPAVESLIASLKDESKDARKRATEGLGLIGDARAAEPLAALLRDESNYVRNAVIKAMVEIGAPAVEPLSVLLRDADGSVRMRAAKALGLIGDARAAEPLIAPLKDESKSVRDAALEALVKIGAPAVGPLSIVLNDRDSSTRAGATKALGRIGDAQAVDPLVTMLGTDDDSDVLRAAAEALVKIGNRRAVKPLVELIRKSPYAWVREALAAMLETLGGEPDSGQAGAMYWVSVGQWDRCSAVGAAAVPALAAVLRAGATEAGNLHGSQKDPGGLPSFTSVLKERRAREQRAKELGVGVRAAAASALGRVGDAGSVRLLVAVLRDRDWQVREAALDGLRKAGWEPAEDGERAAYWLARGDVNRLAELGLQALGPLLLESMEWQMGPDDWHVKGQIAKLLALPGTAATDAALVRASDQLEAYAKKYAETLDGLVRNPRRSDRGLVKRGQAMFGDYADLMTAATSYRETSSGDGSGGRIYRHDTSSSLSAVEHLCQIVTPVSTSLLHHLAQLADVRVTSRTFEVAYDSDHPSGTGRKTETLSFERQRHAATRELDRRGNPDYDLSVYKAADCWRIPKE